MISYRDLIPSGVFSELRPVDMAEHMITDVMDKLKPGEKIKVKVIKIDPGSAKIGLSAKIDEEQDSPTS